MTILLYIIYLSTINNIIFIIYEIGVIIMEEENIFKNLTDLQREHYIRLQNMEKYKIEDNITEIYTDIHSICFDKEDPFYYERECIAYSCCPLCGSIQEINLVTDIYHNKEIKCNKCKGIYIIKILDYEKNTVVLDFIENEIGIYIRSIASKPL
jgi:hypothetical protein